jgi:hypothetical protein
VVLALLEQDPRKESIEYKRLRAGWDNDFLGKLLGLLDVDFLPEKQYGNPLPVFSRLANLGKERCLSRGIHLSPPGTARVRAKTRGRAKLSAGKCQYIPNSFVVVDPEQLQGYNKAKNDPRGGSATLRTLQPEAAAELGPRSSRGNNPAKSRTQRRFRRRVTTGMVEGSSGRAVSRKPCFARAISIWSFVGSHPG